MDEEWGVAALRQPCEERKRASRTDRVQALEQPLLSCHEELISNSAYPWKSHASCRNADDDDGEFVVYSVKCFGKEMAHSTYLRACTDQGYRQATFSEARTFFRLGYCLAIPRQQPIHVLGSYRHMAANPPIILYSGMSRRCDLDPSGRTEDMTWVLTDRFVLDMSVKHPSDRRFLLVDLHEERNASLTWQDVAS